MSSEELLEKVRGMAQEVANREGCVLYDVEYIGGSRGRGRLLRVFIEKKNPGGVTSAVSIDDCANVSRGLNLILDVEDVIPDGPYHLEVSSPGLERILRRPEHFQASLGKSVSFKTLGLLTDFNPGMETLKGRKSFAGVLSEAGENEIVVEGEGMKVRVPISEIQKCRLVFDFGRKSLETGKGKKGKGK